MHLNAVRVSVVEDSDAVLDVVESAALPEEEVVWLRFSVVAGEAEEARAGRDGREVEARGRPHH